MAWDAYLHLDGVEGEAIRKGHEGDIPLISFTVGGSLPIRTGPGQPLQVTGRAAITRFSFRKDSDKSSPQLFQAMCHNLKFHKAVISFYRAGSNTSIPYFEFELKDVVLASMTWNGSETEYAGIPQENVTLNFDRIRVTYTEVGADGTASGTVEAEYDIGLVDMG